MFEYIRKHHNKPGIEQKLERTYAYHNVYQTELGDNQKALQNTLSDLNLWLKDFLLVQKATQPSFESRMLWLHILQERGLSAEFSKQAVLLQEEIDQLPKRSLLDYLKSMATHHYAYFYLNMNSASEGIPILQKNTRELELYQLAFQLRIDCERAHYKKMLPSDILRKFWPSPAEPSKPTVSVGQPLLFLYQALYQLIEMPEVAQFNRVKALLTAHAGSISPKEIDEILLYLFNYASAKVRRSETKEDWMNIHQLNKLAVEHQVFIQKSEMATSQFLNIVNAACKAQDFDWANWFINSLDRHLPAASGADAILVANAILNAEKKEFITVVNALEDAPMKDLHLIIRSKLLLLIGYYELNRDAAKSLDLCTNFEAFLRRNRKPLAGAIKGTLNFVQVLKVLIRRKAKKGRILAKIKKMEVLYYRIWLQEKLGKYQAL